MRAVADGRLAMGPGVREHLELCLDCRACESACPSGRPVRQDDRALQDRARELGDGKSEDQLAPASDSPSPVSLLRPGQARAGTGAAVAAGRLPRLGRTNGAVPPAAADPEADAGDAAQAERFSRPLARGAARRSDRSGRGWPCSSVAWPTPCSRTPTRRRRASFRKTAARS